MKALTITQPWLYLITDHGKDVENRTYGTPHRGPLALHAGARTNPSMARAARDAGWSIPAKLPTGAVLAVCDLVDVHPADSRKCRCSQWAEQGPRVHHWVLADVRVLRKPVPCNGARRLWTLPAAYC